MRCNFTDELPTPAPLRVQMSATQHSEPRSVAETVARLRDAYNAFFASPCIYGMHPDEVADHLAAAIPVPQTQTQSRSRWPDPIMLFPRDCYGIASDIVDLVWQARLQDPLSVLPRDICVHLMSFFRAPEVAHMRLVSKEWFDVCNARLATLRYFLVPAAEDDFPPSTYHR